MMAMLQGRGAGGGWARGDGLVLPQPTSLVEHSELEGGTRLGVQLPDVALLGQRGPPKGEGQVQLAPVLGAQEVGGLVNLGGHVQRVDLRASNQTASCNRHQSHTLSAPPTQAHVSDMGRHGKARA